MENDAIKKSAFKELARRELAKRQAGGPKEYEGVEGVAMNATAGLNEGVANLAGAPVDLTSWLLNMAIRGVNSAAGTGVPEIKNPVGGSDMIKSGMGLVGANPDDVAATGPWQRIVRSTGEAAAGAALGAGVPGMLAKGGMITEQAAQKALPIVGDFTLGNVGANASAGAGGQVAVEMAPEELEGVARIVGSIAGASVPTALQATVPAAKAGVQQAKEFVRPMRKEGPRQIAGQKLKDAAVDPVQVIDDIPTGAQELVPGSKPTLFQATGDQGVGQLERGARTQNPAPFLQRSTDQNAARVTSLQQLQQTGNPRALSDYVRNTWRSIDDELAGNVAKSENTASAARNNVDGIDRLPEEVGSSMRGPVASSRNAAEMNEKALWDAVDPDGNLVLPGNPVSQQANEILDNLTPSSRPVTGEEKAIIQVAASYGDKVNLRDMKQLRSRISAAMQQAKIKGEPIILLRKLRGAVETAITDAVENQAKIDLRAVRRGEKAVEDTIAAKLQLDRDAWIDERATARMGENTSTSDGTPVSGGASGVPAASGDKIPNGGGSANLAGDPGVQGDARIPVDPAAGARLKQASDATKQRVMTYDEGVAGELNRPGARYGEYRLPDSQVPGKVFRPGPTGGESLRSYIGAGGSVDEVKDYAAQSLRQFAKRNDGRLDPSKVRQWVQKHEAALAELPDDVRKSFDSVADAEETVAVMLETQARRTKEFERSALAPFMKSNDPGDVTRTVAGIFGGKTAAKDMENLVIEIGSDKEALNSLRRSIVEHIDSKLLSNAEAGTSGVRQIKADQLQTFIRTNRSALSKVFNPEELTSMEAVAKDLQRSNRSVSSSKTPGQSNTAQDQIARRNSTSMPSLLSRARNEGTAIGAGAMTGGWVGAMAGYLGSRVANSLREAGLTTADELVEAALLDPKLAEVLMRAAPDRVALDTRKDLVTALGNFTRASIVGSNVDQAESAPRKTGR